MPTHARAPGAHGFLQVAQPQALAPRAARAHSAAAMASRNGNPPHMPTWSSRIGPSLVPSAQAPCAAGLSWSERPPARRL